MNKCNVVCDGNNIKINNHQFTPNGKTLLCSFCGIKMNLKNDYDPDKTDDDNLIGASFDENQSCMKCPLIVKNNSTVTCGGCNAPIPNGAYEYYRCRKCNHVIVDTRKR